MTPSAAIPRTLTTLDDATRRLAELAAVVTSAGEERVRSAILATAGVVPTVWVEELLLQTYLFAGFPRTLNAMREWRRVHPEPQTTVTDGRNVAAWRADGEATCARVYGRMYDRLRKNVSELHPELDDWMVVEGYGKVLSRPGLDLPRRELCIVAACAAADQDRQLHSHLHGALNVGVAPDVVDALIESLAGELSAERLRTARLLWARVRGK